MKLFTIFALFVSAVMAQTNFLANTKRAKIFEMTDNAVPTLDITMPDTEFQNLKNTINSGNQWSTTEAEFKTKEATMVFTLNNKAQSFDKVTFKLAGYSSRYYPKQAFNIKIRGKENDLYGRKQFRIRSEAREPSFLRSKLFCDINNRLKVPMSVSAMYIRMSINGEFMGFYVMFDSLKMTWAEIEYNDPDTTCLIQSTALNSDLTYQSYTTNNYESENEDNPDTSEFANFLRTLDAANNVSQIEAVMDVDTFFKSVLLDWLTGSWDHFCLYGHNYSMYKPPNGKWTFVLYDFDATFGQDLSMGLMFRSPAGITGNNIDTWTKARFEDWHGNKKIINTILRDKPNYLAQTIQTIIDGAFNPKLLFARIDELKEMIRPYVQEDKTQVNGKLPGRLKTNSQSYDYTFEHWDANCEFTHINTSFSGMTSQSYGLKRWILDKFDFVCANYNVDCSAYSQYLNGGFKYTVTPVTQPQGSGGNPGGWGGGMWGGGGWGVPGGNPGGNPGGWGGGWPQWPQATTTTTTTTTARRTTTTSRRTTTTTTTTKKVQPTQANCWSTALGYPCCANSNIDVAFEDGDGKWGVENDDWCGIVVEEPCWSSALGFKCCSSCSVPVAYTDDDGKWGVENDDWCGIKASC